MIFLFILFFQVFLPAQHEYIMEPSSEFIVTGTSNVKSWEMRSTGGVAKARIVTGNNRIKSIKELSVTLPAESLKSGKEGMDKKAYKAMKTQEYGNITYTLKEITGIKEFNDHSLLTTTGYLTIAGVEREIVLTVKSYILQDVIVFEGATSMKMSDFNVRPPTALLGTLKTDDAITVSFRISFKPS